MMLELFSLDDVGQGYDLAQDDPDKIAVTMGRHSGDYVTSFYTWNPSGFMVEYGWGGAGDRRQHLEAVRAQARPEPVGPRPHAGCRRRSARKPRSSASSPPRPGLRQPVQVIEGNYNRMPGVCPWWDQMKAQKTG